CRIRKAGDGIVFICELDVGDQCVVMQPKLVKTQRSILDLDLIDRRGLTVMDGITVHGIVLTVADQKVLAVPLNTGAAVLVARRNVYRNELLTTAFELGVDGGHVVLTLDHEISVAVVRAIAPTPEGAV